MALVLDGRALATQIEADLLVRVEALKAKTGRTPILATILVGDDGASATYVRMKGNACRRVGILLQHPVPEQIDERACFDAISLAKDVDGVTCLGFGRMAMGEAAYGSATPAGIMTILQENKIEIAGQHAVVVGRSAILGKPMAMMLLQANATVTICHSRTQNLPELVKQADIIVGAVGKAELIQKDWIKQGAVVVDAGFHPRDGGGVGDIQLVGIEEVASAYTPVPGGVGPMTITTLIRQTVEAAEKALG